MSRLPTDNTSTNIVAINNHRFRLDLDESGEGVTYDLDEQIETVEADSDCEEIDSPREGKKKHIS
jgi:hypothetical protein